MNIRKKYKYIFYFVLVLILLSIFLYFMNWRKKDELTLDIAKNKKNIEVSEKLQKQFIPIPKEEVFEIIENNKTSEINLIKEKFDEADSEIRKSLYASILLRLGVQDEKYITYLKGQAEKIINDDRPYPVKKDENGNEIKGEYNPEFEDWCKKNNIELRQCTAEWFYSFPSIMGYLGLTNNELFFEYLKSGLNSTNDGIVLNSVSGLGILGDPRGIDLIEDAIKNTDNPGVKHIMAQSLLFIDDPYAEDISKQYIEEKNFNYYKEIADNKRITSLISIY